MQYPVARRSDTVEEFRSAQHGVVKVLNPYDWLDNLDGEETKAFMRDQNGLVDQYLFDPALEPAKNKVVAILQSMLGEVVMHEVPKSAGNFYLLRVGGRGQSFSVTFRIEKSRIQDFLTSVNKGSFSETGLTELHNEAEDGQVLISSGISNSGRYWAYNSSIEGSDWGVIRVKDINTREALSDEIHDSKFNTKPESITWLGDLGFFYQYWKPENGGRAAPQLRFHRLGQPQELDELIYENASQQGNCFSARVSQCGEVVFLHQYKSGWESMVYSARVPKNQGGSLDLVFDVQLTDDYSAQWDYIGPSLIGNRNLHLFWTDKDNGHIVGFTPHSSESEVVIAPSETATLKFARLIGSTELLVVRSVDVRDQLQIHSTVGGHHITTLNTKLATVYDASSDIDTNDLFLLEFSFCYPPALWHVDTSEITKSTNNQIQRLQLFSDSLDPQTPLVTQQVFYNSTDGTKIPMFITSEEGRSIGPDTPVLLYVYGGFGISVIPHFRPDILPFIRAFHGVFAVANIRGGGEYGLGWYTGACKENRQRLFDDIKTGVRHLKESLGSSKVILMGESMGGLNCATAIVQDPSLVNAAILNAGAFDVLRLRKSMADDRGKGDVGDPDIPAEFDFIYRWAPLENMEETVYPAILMVTGDKDDVVTFANSGKMAASLQHSTRSQAEAKPVHLRTYANLGHGGNMPILEKAKMWVERWLWIHKTLGLEV